MIVVVIGNFFALRGAGAGDYALQGERATSVAVRPLEGVIEDPRLASFVKVVDFGG